MLRILIQWTVALSLVSVNCKLGNREGLNVSQKTLGVIIHYESGRYYVLVEVVCDLVSDKNSLIYNS